jgi:undecaprenyl pyrophosphate synthase
MNEERIKIIREDLYRSCPIAARIQSLEEVSITWSKDYGELQAKYSEVCNRVIDLEKANKALTAELSRRYSRYHEIKDAINAAITSIKALDL